MKRNVFIYAMSLFALCRCGIVHYPGQPGMVTNSYVKIDLEDLQGPGLFVYEVVYDNKTGGQGVGAVITKLYPNAQTYTSNVRTNADGTLYRSKAQYDGAEVQMISIPSLNQVHVSPNSKVSLMIDYVNSLDEIDDKNTAEQSLFKPASRDIASEAFGNVVTEFQKMRWDILRAGSLTRAGNLSYEVTSLDMGGVKFSPAKSVKFETTFFQNAIRSSFAPETKAEFIQFLEANFPKGYTGNINVMVKGSTTPIPMKIGINTLKTLEAGGTKIIRNATEALAKEVLQKFQRGSLKEGVTE